MVHHELVTGAEIALRPGTVEVRLQVPRTAVEGTRVEVRDAAGEEVRGLVRHLPLVVAHAALGESVRVHAVNAAGFPSGTEVTVSLRIESPGQQDEIVAERLQVGGQRDALLLDVVAGPTGLLARLPRAHAALGAIADHARGVARSSGLSLPTPDRVVVDGSASMTGYTSDGRLAAAVALVQGVLAAADHGTEWVVAGDELIGLPPGAAVDLPERVSAAVSAETVVGSRGLEGAIAAGPATWILTDLPPSGWTPESGTTVLTLVDTLDGRPGILVLPPTAPGAEGAERRRATVLELLSDLAAPSARGGLR